MINFKFHHSDPNEVVFTKAWNTLLYHQIPTMTSVYIEIIARLILYDNHSSTSAFLRNIIWSTIPFKKFGVTKY